MKAKTQNELIEHYSDELGVVIELQGAASDHTTYAFFLLQAAKIGIPQKEMYKWATKKLEALHEEVLELL
jgi:hypothetical protein